MMKNTLLCLLFWVGRVLLVYAQTDPVYSAQIDSVRLLAKSFYNAKQPQNLYALMGDAFKEKIPEAQFLQISEGLWQQLGAWQDDEWISLDGKVASYKSTFTKALIAFKISLDAQGKITTYLFRPYENSQATKAGLVESDNPQKTDIDKAVEAVIRPYIQLDKTVGISVGVLKDGQTYFYNYGATSVGANQLPTQHTLFEIGSITKTFTAFLLANAVLEDKAKLDDAINLYLPNNANEMAYQGQFITLQHLANHSSGLPRLSADLQPDLAKNPQNPYQFYTHERMNQFFSSFKPFQPVGEKYEYSNLAFGILGVIMEQIYQKTYADLIQEYICQPMQMTETTIVLSEEQRSRFAQGHNEKGEATSAWDFDAYAGAGAIRSTTEDLLRYAQLYVGTPPNDLDGVAMLTMTPTFTYGQNTVGLAWHQYQAGQWELWQHAGGTGGYRSFMLCCPKAKIALVLLTNACIEVSLYGLNLFGKLMGN